MRIAVGGIHIECSTYSPLRTTLPDFRVLAGDDPTAHRGFLFLRDYPHAFIPTLPFQRDFTWEPTVIVSARSP